jgi:hypothetical protein
VINTAGGLTAKGLDRRGEKAILMIDWLSASSTVVEHTKIHWGAERASALAAHNVVVLGIAKLHKWELVVDYDI